MIIAVTTVIGLFCEVKKVVMLAYSFTTTTLAVSVSP